MRTADDILEHHGVKGMKWGRRKDRTAQDIIFRTKPGKKVKTQGGKFHEPTEDAIKAAVARQKAKKSTTDSLTNKELQDAVTRMNLEKQYTQLSSEHLSVGHKLVKSLLGDMGDDEISAIGDFVGTQAKSPTAGQASKVGLNVAKSVVGSSKKK